MLVPELDLEMMDSLAERHEAKGAGFDHAGVNRADGDLVNLLPVDLEKWVVRHRVDAASLEADRFEPWMPGDAHAVLFVELALEAVERQKLGGERVVPSRGIDRRSQDGQLAWLGFNHGGDDDGAGLGPPI